MVFVPTGSVVTPVCGSCLGSYKVIPPKGTIMEPMGKLQVWKSLIPLGGSGDLVSRE